MNLLIRSCIIADPTADLKKASFANYLKLDEADIETDTPENQKIWHFVRDFCRAHGHAPTLSSVRSNFVNEKDDATVNRLEHLSTLNPIYQGDFEQRVTNITAERRQIRVLNLLRQSGRIVQEGIEIDLGRGKKKHLKGATDAIKYIMEQSHSLIAPVFGSKLSGEITHDGPSLVSEYKRVKADPHAGIGNLCAIAQIDDAMGGAKKKELWLHAAFTGGLKSTFMLNWAYNQAVLYGNSTLIFSLEMPYEQCRRILFAMHSLHPVFRDIRLELGIQKDPRVDVGLDYSDIKHGNLSPQEERFLFEHVVPHFETGPSVITADGEPVRHGKIHIEVADPDKTDFTMADLRTKAEMLYADSPFQTLFVDHAGLMSPRKWMNSTTERLNEVLRDLKKMAMSFNRGQGMAVVALFQINREGYKRNEAKRDKGGVPLYNLTDLSYANEAERSSDIVSASWVDMDLMKKGRAQFQCLKSRDQAPFEPFYVRVEWPCRRMISCDEMPDMGDQKREEVAQSIEKATQEEIDNLFELGDL